MSLEFASGAFENHLEFESLLNLISLNFGLHLHIALVKDCLQIDHLNELLLKSSAHLKGVSRFVQTGHHSLIKVFEGVFCAQVNHLRSE